MKNTKERAERKRIELEEKLKKEGVEVVSKRLDKAEKELSKLKALYRK